MEKINWNDRMTIEEVFNRVKEQRTILVIIKKNGILNGTYI